MPAPSTSSTGSPQPKEVYTRSMSAVAEAAGVSAMTVSRVLRNSPKVSPQTRERVLTAADSIGYQPDPHIAKLMEVVRSHRAQKVRAKLAFIRDNQVADALHANSYNYMRLEDIRSRAERHGYEVDEFQLGGGNISPTRLRTILSTRGIGGLLISVQSQTQLSAQMDYSGFAAATFGYGLVSPELHRASTNMMQGILATMRELEARGYQRIGIAISPWVDARADYTYSGAMLYYQQTLLPQRRVPLFLFDGNKLEDNESAFCQWMRHHKPDALISLHSLVPSWIEQKLSLQIGKDIGLVVHDRISSMAAYAGIDHRRAHVAAASVDLVVTQLQQNEHGVPPVPRQILIPPLFVDGPSIRPATAKPLAGKPPAAGTARKPSPKQ